MSHFGDYQNIIYFSGLNGVLPKYPVDFATLQTRAEAAMSPSLLNYVQGGCGDEHTQDVNASAFRHWGMVPRMLVDTSKRDLSIELFGCKLPSPLFMSPIGVTGLCTQDGHGDIAAARASAETGVPLMLSTLSNDPLEAVAAETGDTPAFFQLYTPKTPTSPRAWSSARKRPAHRAIIVTLDTWVTGWLPARSELRAIFRSCAATCCRTISAIRSF
ncbi:MAG: alpha-hydroxy-acid oxidizing protein [Hyphomonadaceae bacterium]